MLKCAVDISTTGEDTSVASICSVEGKRYEILPLITWSKEDPMQSCGRIEALHNKWHFDSITIDAEGVGAGVYARLQELGLPVISYRGSMGTDKRDLSGENGFTNLRSYVWWNARDLLCPMHGFNIKLPKDDILIGDLTCVKWTIQSGAKIKVQPKEEVVKKLRRSPDRGDSVCMVLADLDNSAFEENYTIYSGGEIGKALSNEKGPPPSEIEWENRLLFGGAMGNHDVFAPW